MAARSRARAVIRILIRSGGNVHADNSFDETLAHYSTYEGKVALVNPFYGWRDEWQKAFKIRPHFARHCCPLASCGHCTVLPPLGEQIQSSQSPDTMRLLDRMICNSLKLALIVLPGASIDIAIIDDRTDTFFHLITQHESEDTIETYKTLKKSCVPGRFCQ
jgi:hypothetical protein